MSSDLFYKTSTPTFLIKMALIIFLIGGTITSVYNIITAQIDSSENNFNELISHQDEFSNESLPQKIQNYIDNDLVKEKEWVHYTLFICEDPNDPFFQNLRSVLSKFFLLQNSETLKTCGYLLEAFGIEGHPYAEKLKEIAEHPNSLRFQNLIYFNYLKSIGKNAESLSALLKECKFADAEDERRLFLYYAYKTKNVEALKQALEEPMFSKNHIDIGTSLSALNKDYLGLLKYVYLDLLDIKLNGIFFLALILGIVWLAIWVHAANPNKILSGTTGLCITGFLLGICSTAFTIFVIYIMDELGPFDQGTTAISGLAYYIIGVGLKEEVIKLLFVLPLVPFLLKRKDTLEWLIVPACVGLGFAVEENINYLISSEALAATGRFFTANFLHVALTALAGESLIYLFYYKGKTLTTFVQTFGLVVLIHGLYDAFIAVPSLRSLNIISFITLLFIAKIYFNRLKEIRRQPSEPISLTTHFIFGVCISTMAIYIFHGTNGGHMHAIKVIMPSLLDNAIIIYMFLYNMPNSIIKL